MLVKRGHIMRVATMAILLVALALEAIGCKAQPAEWSELGSGGERPQSETTQRPRSGSIQVVPQSNREVADLSPDDVVRIMRRIGFTDEQILELGTAVHDALFLSGAARVVKGNQTEAIVRVSGAQVYVGSRWGTLVYDFASGQFVTPGAPR